MVFALLEEAGICQQILSLYENQMYPATTQTRHINIKVPPVLFEHYQAMEKRSYQYKFLRKKNLYHFTYLYFATLSLPRQSPSTIKIIGLSYLARL